MHKLLLTTCFFVLTSSLLPLQAQQVVDLAGMWEFAQGDLPQYNDVVMLPGSMLTNGKGDDVTTQTQWTGSLYDSSFYFNPAMEKYRYGDELKLPFFLTPSKHYVGNAWYRRTFYVPASLKGERIILFLERPHIETTVFVNGEKVGHQTSLSTPHVYDVTDQIKTGAKNEVAIRVYNGIENVGVGQDSHSVTDQTQGNWNGIVGKIELQARPKKLNIRKVRVYPDVEKSQAVVVVELENHVDGIRFFPLYDYYVYAEATPINGTNRMTIQSYRQEALKDKLVFTIDFGKQMQTWDEFHPVVYQLTVHAGDDIYETQFGMRNIKAEGRQLLLNGRPIWLRGTVENCCFPDTGYPPTDEESWMRIFRKCREYGINHVRFHSYCPPEAAFSAADLCGIYLQPEGPSWPNHGVRLLRGMNIDQYLLEESKRIVDTYGNHPSFVMMAAGNEPAGNWVPYCNDWVAQMHDYDPTRLYCGASVGGGWAWDNGSEFHVKGGARGLDWDRHQPQSSDDYFEQIRFPRNYTPHPTEKNPTGENLSPVITHEQGQWCAFPDLKEVHQYTGAYRARNFEIFSDLLTQNGMKEQAEKFLMASGKLQTLCYKFEIERNLRTKDYAGFQLLSLNDYSGQGTALVGPLNVFWREKGYVDAKQWREFCAPIVTLARFPRFVFSSTDTLRVPVEAYNAYHTSLKFTCTRYAITDQHGDTLVSNRLTPLPSGESQSEAGGLLPIGKNIALGTVVFPLAGITSPTKCTLALNIENVVGNHYDFWVYPPLPAFSSGEGRREARGSARDLYVCDTLDTQALKVLKKGGKVLLTAAGKITYGSDVKQTYLPVFWNTSWFKMRPPHTTGAVIDDQHPLFRHFPTDNWANLNWWELLNRAQVINLSPPLFGKGTTDTYQSPVQPIDTWHVSRKLGMILEANVMKGKLFLTTMDITSDLDHRLVARQMRHAILTYMQSDEFQPAVTLPVETIQSLFSEQAPPVNMFTNDSPDELKPKLTNP